MVQNRVGNGRFCCITTEHEHTTSQIDTNQAGPFKSDPAHIRAPQIGTIKLGLGQVCAVEHDRKHVTIAQVSLFHRAASHVRARQFGLAQDDPIKLVGPQIAQRQIRRLTTAHTFHPTDMPFDDFSDFKFAHDHFRVRALKDGLECNRRTVNGA